VLMKSQQIRSNTSNLPRISITSHGRKHTFRTGLIKAHVAYEI